MNTLLSLFLFIIAIPELGPTGSIEGTITNNQNKALSYAHIALPDLNKGTISDQDGGFIIRNVPVGEHRVRVSHIGYYTEEAWLMVEENKISTHTVSLTPSMEMPQLEVVGQKPDRLSRIPGSASIISPQQLKITEALSGTEVFRMIPGVHSTDHEGMGLRANIGLRGLDPDRSRNVLILEDGIPVALAPYGEPELYYTPSIARMESVEVIKGSGSILFGPQTIGGVVNYITPSPPPEQETSIYVSGGEKGYLTTRLSHGNTFNNSGFHINYLHRRADDLGSLHFHLNDLNAKWKLVTGSRSAIGLKLSIYDERSNSTYVGLTQPMYESGDFDYMDIAPDDELHIRRYAASLIHDYFPNDQLFIRTAAFAYTTRRDWSRQDFDHTPRDGVSYHRISGDPSLDHGALYFRPTTGNRNREFEVAGLEPRVNYRFFIGSYRNELDAGARFLYERAYEQRVNGSIESPATGNIRNDEIRTGYAASAFVQNRVYLHPRLTLTPGLRFEYFHFEREILRDNFLDASILGSSDTHAFIPGFGVNYQWGPSSSVFAGVHRGFSPPRVKDALTSDGTSYELDAEWSWSYEIGTRVQLFPFLRSEITAYLLQFENQIIPVSESSGGIGDPNATGLTNGGATEHIGLEFLVELAPFINPHDDLQVHFTVGGSWNHSTFSEDRYVLVEGTHVNVNGNRLPYAPEWNGFSQLSLGYTSFSGFLKVTFTGEQYGDVLNSDVPSLNGRSGPLASYTVFDAGLKYQLPLPVESSFSVSVKNLTNERYIMSRRPQGIRLGLPRMITFGLTVDL
ncbi:TonB-dependent receptor [Balneolaceae bacterium ANBcel3]|nr:TonB-dependent receptor [Balneolaceae bacterium ANBcel3]